MFQKEFPVEIGLQSPILSKYPVCDTPINNKVTF